MSFYQSIAPFYDFIFPPSKAQSAFVCKQMGTLKDKNILEAGCGTGNLAMMLAEQGAIVKGIDLDHEMIDRASAKAKNNDNADFRNMDILKISESWSPQYFDGIVSFGNTIVHLSGINEVKQFFSGAHDLLKPGGKLMVQIINYDRILDKGIKSLPIIENDQIRFERYYDLNDGGDGIDFSTILTVKQSGQIIRNVVRLFPLRQNMIEQALSEVGFKNVRFFGNFLEDGLTNNSVPLIFCGEAY